MADRLDRLRHDPVVGGHHQDRDVRDLGAARTHGSERLVARRVDERDAATAAIDLVRTDVLGDAAGFARHDVGVADAIEQCRLAVVDVTHDGDDRRARLEQRLIVLVIGREECDQLDLLLTAGLDDQDLGAELLGNQLDHLVGQRCRRGHHLARGEQDADEVCRRAIQLRRVLLDRAAASDHDLALGYRGVGGCESLRRRFELRAIAATLLAPSLRGTSRSSAAAAGATEAAGTTTGTAAPAAGRPRASTAGTTCATSRAATGRVPAAAATATGSAEAATPTTGAAAGAAAARTGTGAARSTSEAGTRTRRRRGNPPAARRRRNCLAAA